MKQVSEITLEDIESVQAIVKYTIVKNEQVKKMQHFMVNYIDPKCHICGHCSGQIRFAHKRIITYYERYATEISEIKQKLLNPVDVHSCNKCGKELKDKRRKVCAGCKK